eukprot:TRINITY_DN65991_c0_g1_i1.p1 TRINITY_DN65991_c0_g1~~TRINITY_DN65991_c0_g1_i1.p1  ORF type:complete len:160 (-),score=35.19 TRINITY_DN65991_c0_g1_i1:195-674(-)
MHAGMLLNNRGVRLFIEGIHVLILLAFVASTMLIFQDMPSTDLEIKEASPFIGDSLPAVSAVKQFEPSMDLDDLLNGNKTRFEDSRKACEPFTKPLLEVNVEGEQVTQAKSIETDEEIQSQKRSKLCSSSIRISLVSFLIALIGGGTFSLEAFEAFPML